MTSVISAIEAGTGVGVFVDTLGYSFGSRLKLVPVTIEPKPISFGIAARKGRLSPATRSSGNAQRKRPRQWECRRGSVNIFNSARSTAVCRRVTAPQLVGSFVQAVHEFRLSDRLSPRRHKKSSFVQFLFRFLANRGSFANPANRIFATNERHARPIQADARRLCVSESSVTLH